MARGCSRPWLQKATAYRNFKDVQNVTRDSQGSIACSRSNNGSASLFCKMKNDLFFISAFVVYTRLPPLSRAFFKASQPTLPRASLLQARLVYTPQGGLSRQISKSFSGWLSRPTVTFLCCPFPLSGLPLRASPWPFLHESRHLSFPANGLWSSG